MIDCSGGGGMIFRNGEATIHDCRINLSRAVGGEGLRGITFINTVVDYDGGSVPNAPMFFYNCSFQFNVPVVPPPRGAQTMRLLAGSPSMQSIQIPG